MGDHLEVAIPPAVEPVTLDQARDYLRVDVTDEDPFILGLIGSARMNCAVVLRQTILATTYEWFLDGFPAGGGYYDRAIRAAGPGPGWLPGGDSPLSLPNPPLIAVESIQYRDQAGDLVTIPPDQYRVSTKFGSRVQPARGAVWPAAAPEIDAVVIRYTAGRPTPADVDPTIITACLLLIGHWFENRDTTVIGTIVTRLPDAVAALLSTVNHGSYS